MRIPDYIKTTTIPVLAEYEEMLFGPSHSTLGRIYLFGVNMHLSRLLYVCHEDYGAEIAKGIAEELVASRVEPQGGFRHDLALMTNYFSKNCGGWSTIINAGY